MIAIVNYGVGNLASIERMMLKAGGNAKITSDPGEIRDAEKIVLPGVGHFEHAMKMLNASGLRDTLSLLVLELKRPVLGICLGAQIMGSRSEEASTPGLGWLAMTCHRFEETGRLRVPHMGWNEIVPQKANPLTDVLRPQSRFYFVHAYYMRCLHPEDVLAQSTYGIKFASAVQRENMVGVQFHPEKSLRYGLALFEAFARET